MGAALISGIIAAAGAIGGAAIGANAQKEASKIQADSQKKALELQKQEASKAQQEQNRANKQTVNAGNILAGLQGGNSSLLTGSQGIKNEDLNLGNNSLLGSK